MSDVQLMTQMDVTVNSGGELVLPPRLVIRDATFTLDGVLTGVDTLTVGDGGTLTCSATGRTANSSASNYALQTFVVDGRTDGGAASALATLAHGVSLEAQSLQLVHGTLSVHGQVSLEAQLLNLTAGASISGAKPPSPVRSATIRLRNGNIIRGHSMRSTGPICSLATLTVNSPAYITSQR